MAAVLSSLALWHLTLLAGLPLLASQPKSAVAKPLAPLQLVAQAAVVNASIAGADQAQAAQSEPVEVHRGPSLSPYAPGQYQVPLASLPASPPPLGLPLLQGQVSCPALQQRLRAIVGGEAAVWSISVADAHLACRPPIKNW